MTVRASVEGAQSTAHAGSRAALATVYGAALLQGLTVVSFPASANVLKSTYGLDDAGYGSLFLPQMALTIAGSLAGAALAGRLGLRRLLVASLSGALVAELALTSVHWLDPSLRLVALLVGTGFMGAGFGLSAAPLNAYPALLVPRRADTALVALHTSIGVGFALGPLIVSAWAGANLWIGYGACVAAACLLCGIGALFAVFPSSTRVSTDQTSKKSAHSRPARFLLPIFLLTAVVYAFAEGTFANWAAVFLAEDRHVPAGLAALALSGFWFALAAGRLAIAALVTKVPAEWVWLALPVVMIAAFLAIPFASDASTGIALFVLAGLGCSAFFPLTVALASRLAAPPEAAATVSSMLIAALMVGVGSSSFALGAIRERLPLDTVYRLSAVYPLVALVLGALVWTLARRAARP